MADEKPPSLWDALVMQQPLTADEKKLRDDFVTEYLKDRDGWAAAIRCGFLKELAVTYAQTLLGEPYIQQEIARRERQRTENPKLADKEDHVSIRAALFREAYSRGPGSTHMARVNALKALAQLTNMEPAKKVEKTVTHRGGVMLVPAMANLNEWEQAAAKSQDKLLEEARH